jgi:hypothetical protein
MTNAEMEVVEVLFKRPLGIINQSLVRKPCPLVQRQLRMHQTPSVSIITAPPIPAFSSTLTSQSLITFSASDHHTDFLKDGMRVDHVTSAFATRMFQVDNALKVAPVASPGRHWSHALPGILKDPDLQLDQEAQSIQDSFKQL